MIKKLILISLLVLGLTANSLATPILLYEGLGNDNGITYTDVNGWLSEKGYSYSITSLEMYNRLEVDDEDK